MDLGSLAPLIASVGASLLSVLAAQRVARRFQKIGGGEAQEKLNTLRKEIDDAMTEKVRVLEEQFAGCKARLVEVEAEMKRLRTERMDLKQEILDLHREMRDMQTTRQPARPQRPKSND